MKIIYNKYEKSIYFLFLNHQFLVVFIFNIFLELGLDNYFYKVFNKFPNAV